ncbi:toll-like receptor 5 [Thalassophryne amazonica]|uniref:toll-like receptor 5 n=1 Tax=Thalassophryne amazonica TaxID=390379 RepID=UPI001471AA0C|nr:toll-like receptor 5 [Thalassophryne amazonica]
MWILILQAVVICVFLQVPGCFPSCLIFGPVANCGMQNLRWVPSLPPRITHLYLEMNRISEVNASSLSGLEELQVLDIGKQHVPLVIRNNAFSRQQRLTKLVLGFNIGLRLEPQAFLGLSNLQELHLNYCSLRESILKDNYLEPLASLETLDLFGNHIKRVQPSVFFANLTKLKDVNLKLNKIDMICEPDLLGFCGKHFQMLNLNSIQLTDMSSRSFDWKECGNPFRGMSFQTLDLSYNMFSTGKSKQFFRAIEGTKISHLKLSGPMGKGFSHNNLPDPDNGTFEGLRNSEVRILDLSKNRIFALHPRVFHPLKEVAVIDVSKNNINQILRNAFEGLQGHLKSLNLSYNLLGEIYSYTFQSLTNLEILDLSYNHIGVLGYGSFTGLPKLKALSLTGNSLRELGFPASLPSLGYLFLNDNKLTPLSVNSLKRFASNVSYLNVNDNRFTNLGNVYIYLSQFKHLQYLAYGGNTIRTCSITINHSPLRSFQTLDLHSSSMQAVWTQGRCLNLFDNLGSLLRLNLSFNALRSLPEGIFKGLTSVVEIDLSSNAITYLQADVFPRSLKTLSLANNFIASPDPVAFCSLSTLDLTSNRFHCDCNLKSFLTWLNKTNVTFVSPVNTLKCEFPLNLNQVPLVDYFLQLTQEQKQND